MHDNCTDMASLQNPYFLAPASCGSSLRCSHTPVGTLAVRSVSLTPLCAWFRCPCSLYPSCICSDGAEGNGRQVMRSKFGLCFLVDDIGDCYTSMVCEVYTSKTLQLITRGEANPSHLITQQLSPPLSLNVRGRGQKYLWSGQRSTITKV